MSCTGSWRCCVCIRPSSKPDVPFRSREHTVGCHSVWCVVQGGEYGLCSSCSLTHIHTHRHACTRTHTRTHTNARTHAYAHAHTHTQTEMHAHTHAHTHTRTHTHRNARTLTHTLHTHMRPWVTHPQTHTHTHTSTIHTVTYLCQFIHKMAWNTHVTISKAGRSMYLITLTTEQFTFPSWSVCVINYFDNRTIHIFKLGSLCIQLLWQQNNSHFQAGRSVPFATMTSEHKTFPELVSMHILLLWQIHRVGLNHIYMLQTVYLMEFQPYKITLHANLTILYCYAILTSLCKPCIVMPTLHACATADHKKGWPLPLAHA